MLSNLNEQKDALTETKEHMEAIATDVEAVAGGLLFVNDLNKMAHSLDEIIIAANLLKQEDSLSKNLGAQKMESGVTDLLSGGSGGAVHAASMAAQHVPIIGSVHSASKEGLVSAKGATEDAFAAEKLRRQGRKAKHLADHKLPMDIRTARFNDFKSAEFSRMNAAEDRNIPGMLKSFTKTKGGEWDRYIAAAIDFEKKTGNCVPAGFGSHRVPQRLAG